MQRGHACRQAGFSSLILIVVFVLLGGGIFYAGYQYFQKQVKPTIPPATSPTPTPNATANWKTYTSEDKTFSFKYPPQWIYETKKITLMLKYKGKERNIISVSAGIPYTKKEWKVQQEYWGTSNAPKMGNNFLLLYATSPDFKNLNLDNPADDLFSTQMVKENVGYQKDITLKNNITAKEVGYGCQASCIDIYFKNNSTIFDFSTGPNAEANIAILRQILSTFKFLE